MGLRRGIAIAACVLAAVLVPEAAVAATSPTDGGDVSRYQCTTPPVLGDFAVVALNTGLPTETNPCLAAQLAWAAATAPGTGHAAAEVYLAAANPQPKAARWWPKGDTTVRGTRVHSPYGHCSGVASRACSWVYGQSIARDDLHRGVPASVGRWWIDIETEPGGPSWSSSTARNRAVVEGMAAGLTAGGKRVGVYATPLQFHDLIGTVPASSRLSPLPSWIAGAGSEAAALARCTGSGLTAGRVELVQWYESVVFVDHDVACGTLRTAKATTTGTHRAGHRLTARTGTWGPGGVHLAYRWLRDGKAISGATARTYVQKTKDGRHRIAVRITGTERGFTAGARTSASHSVAR